MDRESKRVRATVNGQFVTLILVNAAMWPVLLPFTIRNYDVVKLVSTNLLYTIR